RAGDEQGVLGEKSDQLIELAMIDVPGPVSQHGVDLRAQRASCLRAGHGSSAWLRRGPSPEMLTSMSPSPVSTPGSTITSAPQPVRAGNVWNVYTSRALPDSAARMENHSASSAASVPPTRMYSRSGTATSSSR